MATAASRQRAALVNSFVESVRTPALADTIPPTVPPAPARVSFAKRHSLVRWHRNPSRVTTLDYDSKEPALEAARALDAVAFYKWVVMCGREMIERADLEMPDLPPIPA
jgi:hypothetical protein